MSVGKVSQIAWSLIVVPQVIICYVHRRFYHYKRVSVYVYIVCRSRDASLSKFIFKLTIP